MNELSFSGIHDTQYDEAMLLEQLEECSRAVEKAERYEMQLEIYRLILPTYEKQRDYVALAECFSVLSQACSRANEVNRTGKRLLGTYYRVALYGKVFQVNSFVFVTVKFILMFLHFVVTFSGPIRRRSRYRVHL